MGREQYNRKIDKVENSLSKLLRSKLNEAQAVGAEEMFKVFAR